METTVRTEQDTASLLGEFWANKQLLLALGDKRDELRARILETMREKSVTELTAGNFIASAEVVLRDSISPKIAQAVLPAELYERIVKHSDSVRLEVKPLKAERG